MRIPKEDYQKSKSCLKRYTYNCLNILMIRSDIINISAVNLDGLPHSKYSINDIVANSVIKLEENKELQQSIKEYNAVKKALLLVDDDSRYIFEHIYEKKDMSKWEIVNSGMSERTFQRKYQDLIYKVYEELKKN